MPSKLCVESQEQDKAAFLWPIYYAIYYAITPRLEEKSEFW